MSIEHQPVIGDWYRNATGDRFEVVAVDEQDQTIELQYFDGTVEEIDLETWLVLPTEPIAAPEDWSGSLDIQREDYGYDQDPGLMPTHLDPLDQLDQLDPLDIS